MSRGARHARGSHHRTTCAAIGVIAATVVVTSGLCFQGMAPLAAEGRTGPATINLSPTKLVLTRQAASSSLLMRNESDEAIRFQVSAVKWANTPSGGMEFAPTDDLVYFPTLFILEPKQSRRLRVASSLRAEERELAYRLMIEQLPQASARAPSEGVQMLVRASVPVFVQPRKIVASATLDELAASGGKAFFTVRNTGTVHVVLREVAVRGRLKSGAETPDQRVAGWYLLPGESRRFEVPLPEESCRDWASMVVTVSFGDTTAGPPIVETLAMPAAACGR